MGSEHFIPTHFKEFATPEGRFKISIGATPFRNMFSIPGEGFSIHFADSLELYRDELLDTPITEKTITIPQFLCRNTEDFFVSGSFEDASDLYVPSVSEACALLGEHARILKKKGIAGRLFPPALVDASGSELLLEQYMHTATTLSDGSHIVVGYAPPGVIEVKDPDRRVIQAAGVPSQQSNWFGIRVDRVDSNHRNTKYGEKRAYYANLLMQS